MQPDQRDPNRMTAPWTAKDVLADIKASKGTVPLPPGAVWRSIEVDESGAYGASWGRSMIEFQAACAWFQALVVAHASGDRAAIAASEPTVRAVPTWVTFSDPTLIDAGSRDHIAALVTAALDGDDDDMRSFIAANCGR
jgi:hypothetical protein